MNVDDGRKALLRDTYNSTVFAAARGVDIYIVGGYVRNLLTGRGSRDRDYICGGPLESLVETIRDETDGKLIRLGGEGLHRIVLKDGGTLDFTPLREDIKKDLRLRDFTINAIAWSPDVGWIDPEGGMNDLGRGLVRMVDARNLAQDPLRLLRAYRFASELFFEIDPATRTTLKSLSYLIGKANSERITSEFFKILNLDSAPKAIEMALDDGLLARVIGRPHRDLELTVKALHELYDRPRYIFFKYRIKSDEIFSQRLSHKGLIGLEILLRGITEHHFVLSSKITKHISRFSKAEEFLDSVSVGSSRSGRLFDVFESAGDATLDLLLMRGLTGCVDDFDIFQKIQHGGLLTAEDVRTITGMEPGPALGNTIRALRRAEFAGEIRDRADAVLFLKSRSAMTAKKTHEKGAS